MKNKLLLCFLISLPTFFLFSPPTYPQQEKGIKVSIIGRWRVISDDPNNVKNHTWEFLANNTCIEKYRSDQATGSIDAPPEFVEMDAIITYRYKYLGGRKYRLYPIQSLVGGKPAGWGSSWHIIDVTIRKDKAVVYVADRQEQHKEIFKAIENALDEVEGNKKRDKKKALSPKKEQEIWMKVL